jgi:hypothetical protein
MKRTRFVSFPRSGHHWLVRELQERLGPDWVYDEHHETGNTLEKCSAIHAQKTHDFQLDVSKSPEFLHVVQVRAWEPSAKSWAGLHKCSINDLPAAANVDMDFRWKWIEKWIVEPCPNRLIVRYEDMLTDLMAVVDSVVAHIEQTPTYLV